MKKEELLIVSDLHLCEGPQSPNEDFFYDKEFAQFLGYHDTGKKTLVINGDFVDFLQVTSTGNFSHLSSNEARFGLGTEQEKSAFKLQRVMRNHRTFFRALCDFAGKGHKVVIVPGNHDAEFFWPAVQATFYKELSAIKGAKAVRKNITFSPWFYHVPDLAYIEHGNQYDPLNSFEHFLNPVLPNNPRQLDLPFGSFTVRYFLNMVEKTDPLADNFKPPLRYLNIMLARDPGHVLEVFIRYIPFLFRAWTKSLAHFSPKKVQSVRLKQEQTMLRLAKTRKVPYQVLHLIDSLKQVSIMHRPFFFYEVFQRHLFFDNAISMPLARQIKEAFGVKFVVMGHTHYALHRDFFLNTGTWTTVVEDKGVLAFEKKLNYVHIKDGKAKLLEWK